MSNNKPQQPKCLPDNDISKVEGGALPHPLHEGIIKPIDPPVYITLAIGEGGGDLPVQLS